MSAYSILNCAITPGLSSSERLVYLYIVGRANGAGVCWPSLATICADLDLSRRTVIGATMTLRKRGLLNVKPRYQDTNNYFVINVAGLRDAPAYADRSARPERTPMPYDDDEPPVQNSTPIPEPEVQKLALMEPDGCKKGLLTVQNLAPQTVQQESNKVSTSLRSAAPDVRAEVFTEGLQIIRSLTGKPEGGSRRLLGQMCKTAGDDCARVMAALRNALDHRPAEPVSFILGSLRPRSTFETIHAKLGTTSLWATINDDDDVLEGELP